jgi:outer membrane cobalamin receptor
LEDDGARANNISSSLGYEPVSFLSLRLIHRYSDSETEIDNAAYDDDPNHTNRAREGLIKGEVSAELLGGDWTQTLSFSQTRQHLLDLNDKDQDHPTDASALLIKGVGTSSSGAKPFVPTPAIPSPWGSRTARMGGFPLHL